MKRWSLRPDPSPHDHARHVLLISGEMKHVSQLVKKFGAMCGRPMRIEHPEGFNFSILLHAITKTGIEKVAKYLAEIAPGAQGDLASAAPAPTLPKIPSLVRDVPSVPTDELFKAPPVAVPTEAETPAAGPVLAPPPLAAPILPAAPAAREKSVPPALVPPSPPVPAAPAVSLPALHVPTTPPSAAPPLAVPAPGMPTSALAPAAAAPSAATTPPAATPAAGRPLWGLHARVDPKLTFESLLVGAYNRFAHAAATSVVGAPGTMYNPLFIYGAPGVGKTHLLCAIGTAFRKTWDEASVLRTTGACLSSAVSGALAAGGMGEIDRLVAGAKALLVDDMHLLAITEKNQAALAKFFGDFFSRGLQVVLTSVYPPRTLGAMEDALKISLSKGWAVDMKVANAQVQEDMLNALVERCGAQLAAAEIKKLLERLAPNYGEASRLVRRWICLGEVYRAKGSVPSSDDMVGDLLSAGAKSSQADMPNMAELETGRTFAPPAPAPDAPNLALFCPRGQDAMATWLVARFYKVGAEFGIHQTFRHVLCESYDAEQPFGVPFQIGESCQRSNAQAALVLGPPREAKLAARESEFAHAVRHILEGFGIAAGWIPFTETTTTRPFLAAHLDFKAALKR
ncbi:MAG: ATP-binding protein [Elusimicrobia bacterium]|nr:ATP-binding protein [Elusimicrobiota bacterium]